MADTSRRLLIAVITLVCVAGFADSLWCYQCVDSGNDKDCQDAKRLLNVTNKNPNAAAGDREDETIWKRNKYYKECEDNETMCMIETYEAGDSVRSYHRDCTDGHTFSFSADKYPRLINVPSNNQSRCTYDTTGTGFHVCLSLCEGDLCNGPKMEKQKPKVCRNETDFAGEVTLVCGGSSLTHFLTLTSLDSVLRGVFGVGAIVPFFVYVMCIGIVI